MVFTDDFSVVIQGPVIGVENDPIELRLTKQCINSIRTTLPGSEIIISTWEGTNVDNLDVDKVIFNKDPGAITYNDSVLKTTYNNSNRQIVSTYNGLLKASRKYSIKMRGDCILLNNSFQDFINKYNATSDFSFLNHKIIVPTYFSRNPIKLPLLYHLSDIFQVGLTEDLQALWNIPLQPEPETTRAKSTNYRIWNDPFPDNKYKAQYMAEQYIWYAFTKKKGLNLSLDYYCQTPILKIFKSLLSVVNNFIIVPPQQLGLQLPKRLLHGENYLYTHEEWLKEYNDICVNKSLYLLILQVLKVKLISYKFICRNILKKQSYS